MKHRNIDKIQTDVRSKFGITKANSHLNKKSGGKKKQDRWGGLSRKEARKAARKKKKEKMNATYLTKFSKYNKVPLPDDVIPNRGRLQINKSAATTQRISRYAPAKSSVPISQVKETNDKQDTKKQNRHQGKLQSLDTSDQSDRSGSEDERTTTQSQLHDAVVAQEEKEMRQLEKKLKMKKRSSLPKAFMDDGLDYLLDVVDADKLKMMADTDESESDTDTDSISNDDEPVEMSAGKNKKQKTESGPFPAERARKVRFADEVEEAAMEEENVEGMEEESGGEMEEESGEEVKSEEGENEEEEREFDDGEGGEEEDVEGDDFDEMNSEEEDDETEIREDIYGRLVDKKGNLVSAAKKADSSAAYIPPAKRAAMLAGSAQRSQELERLKKQMKGLLNRASESNMQSIANTVEDLYMSNSRASVNESLFTLICEAVVSTVMTPERLVAEMAMLVAILHGNVGIEVGAYFLQHVTQRYDELRQHEGYGGGHTIDNVLLLLAYLYNFKVVNHVVIFDIVTQLVESYSEKDIELILLILKCAGFYLRRDDPESLGTQITAIQSKARSLDESGTELPSRMRFMLEVLMAIRNNNVRRVPGADVDRTDRMRKTAGTFVRGGGLADNQLNIGLKDLLRADQTGRWWIVGSAWEGRTAEDSESNKAAAKASTATSVSGAISQRLVHLGKRLGMNTDIRRSIFYAIMSSEDYLDAFQKVLQLGLKGQQEREIVVVTVECCKKESKFNPFYSHLLERLARHERRFMIATQFHMWDMFKAMDDINQDGRHNLAMLLAHLLSTESLTLAVFKVLEFGALSKSVVKFLKITFTELLTSTPVAELNLIFRRIGQQQKLRSLSDGLRVFLTKHIRVKKLDAGEAKSMKNKLEEVCAELSVNRQTVL